MQERGCAAGHVHVHVHVHVRMCMSESRVQRCVWLLTASGVGEHPAAIGAVVDAIIPHHCQTMRLAQVDDGELVRLLVKVIGVEDESP